MAAAPTVIEETSVVSQDTSQEGTGTGASGSGRVDVTSRHSTRRIKARANLTSEYVAGRGWSWGFLNSMVQALSAYIDDITRDFGIDQYERMMTDSQIASVVKLMVMAVLADGVQLSPGVDKDDEQYEQAKLISDFCDRNLSKLKQPLIDVLYEMIEGAVVNGHKVADKVFAIETWDKAVGPQLVLKGVKPKPQRNTAFVVDPYMNVLGLLQAQPGQALPKLDGDLSTGDTPPVLISREKFAVLTHLGKNGDPRGTSVLRSVYTAWWIKQQTWVELRAYLARFGSPSAIATTSVDAQDEVIYDTDGVTELSRRTPEEVALDQLEQVRNGAAGAFPPGSEVQLLEASGKGEPFFQTLAVVDTQIAKGVLLQTLTTEEGKHQSRAASSTHQDVFGLLIHFLKGVVIFMLQQDILTPLVEYNYGEEALDLTPKVTLGEVDQQDFKTFADGVAALARVGILHESQYAAICEMLHLPPADEEAVKADRERADVLADKIAEQPQDEDEGDEQDGSSQESGDVEEEAADSQAESVGDQSSDEGDEPASRRGGKARRK